MSWGSRTTVDESDVRCALEITADRIRVEIDEEDIANFNSPHICEHSERYKSLKCHANSLVHNLIGQTMYDRETKFSALNDLKPELYKMHIYLPPTGKFDRHIVDGSDDPRQVLFRLSDLV